MDWASPKHHYESGDSCNVCGAESTIDSTVTQDHKTSFTSTTVSHHKTKGYNCEQMWTFLKDK